MFGSFGGAIGGLMDFATSAWSKNEDQKHADTQAWVQRNYQSQREDTAYQRTIADLNAAGLSPMLAYSKGPLATGTSPTAGGGQSVSSDFSGSSKRDSERELLKQQVDVAKSQELLNIQTAKKVAEDAKASAINVEQMPTRFMYDLAVLGSQVNANSANAAKSTVDATNNANLVTPGSDPYWYRDMKKNFSSGKQAIDDVIGKTWNKLRGRK
jgi:hypothetical protein